MPYIPAAQCLRVNDCWSALFINHKFLALSSKKAFFCPPDLTDQILWKRCLSFPTSKLLLNILYEFYSYLLEFQYFPSCFSVADCMDPHTVQIHQSSLWFCWWWTVLDFNQVVCPPCATTLQSSIAVGWQSRGRSCLAAEKLKPEVLVSCSSVKFWN